MEENWKWVDVVSDKQARFFMSLGAAKVRFGKNDTRDRRLYDLCPVTAVDDSGAYTLESFYRSNQNPQVYMNVNRLKKDIKKEYVKMIPHMSDGEPCTNPIDFFYGAIPAEEWITQELEASEDEDCPYHQAAKAELIAFRTKLYEKAKEKYFEIAKIRDFSALREVPLVVTNYDYGTSNWSPNMSYWFLFKEDNNGNTYKIYSDGIIRN